MIYIESPDMEMPVNCTACGRWVELNDTYRCDSREDLRCPACYREWEHEQGTEGAEDAE